MRRFVLLAVFAIALFTAFPGQAEPACPVNTLGLQSCLDASSGTEACAWTYAHAANFWSCTTYNGTYEDAQLYSDDYAYWAHLWGSPNGYNLNAYTGSTYLCGHAYPATLNVGASTC